ncbi:hypothetical protein A0H81_14262 [Grifola frondosa]|uniref:Uncharacterized protein n=1 Tax=Grifola frondosa TaxID=5627 RepID=A0A1C7LLI7_GRIFR|nr:hypothetical protein A0H81_14262 [Grifola frondosa]
MRAHQPHSLTLSPPQPPIPCSHVRLPRSRFNVGSADLSAQATASPLQLAHPQHCHTPPDPPPPGHHNHTHTHNHHQYSPSTRAADISRLLDPAYASSSSSSSSKASPTHATHAQARAYVDEHGDLHDPDYRDFPILRATARSKHMTKRRRASAGSTGRSHSTDRYSTYSLAMHPTRPSWERDWSTEVEDDDDDDVDDNESQSHFSPFASRVLPPTRRSTTYPMTTKYAFTTYAPQQHYFFTEPLNSSPAGSYEEEQESLEMVESPFVEDEVAEAYEEDLSKSASLLRRNSKKRSADSSEQEKMDSDDFQHLRSPLDDDDDDEQGATPTCTHTLRQQWQAVSLRIRFGVFHAKRRLSRHLRT